jgi:hypothetical protein
MRRVWFLIAGLALLGGALGCHHTAGYCDCVCLPVTCVYGPLGTPAHPSALAPAPVGETVIAPGASLPNGHPVAPPNGHPAPPPNGHPAPPPATPEAAPKPTPDVPDNVKAEK